MAEIGHEVEGDVIGIQAGLRFGPGLPDQPEARRLPPVPRLHQPDQFLLCQRVVFAHRPAILTGREGESTSSAGSQIGRDYLFRDPIRLMTKAPARTMKATSIQIQDLFGCGGISGP